MNIAVANRYLEELKEKVMAVTPMDQVKYVSTEVRNGRANVELNLIDVSERTISSYVLADQIRDQIEGSIPGGFFRVRAQSGLWILRRIFGSGGDEAVQKIQESLSDLQLPQGFSVVYSGEYEEQQKAQTDFIVSILMALGLIYMVMAAQFERFLDPLIVMFAVPVAIVGVIPTMLLTNTTFNMQSIMGVIMLVGIVVNNAIVLVDYINLMRRDKNMNILEAVIESGRLRLRPILMTTLTTVLGLLPLSFGWGAGGEIQAALARVVIGGLTASTLITLVLIPVVYITAHGIKEYVLEKKAAFLERTSDVAIPQTTQG